LQSSITELFSFSIHKILVWNIDIIEWAKCM
jgi:hypothetical protein